MHKLKRFYLLSATVSAVLIPLITFTTVIVQPLETVQFIEPITIPTEVAEPSWTWLDSIPYIIWSIYGFGVAFFSWRFILNFREIHLKIKNNPKQKHLGFTNVLLNSLVVPYTFFNYIFLNKTKFENNAIPEAVFLHEQAHAKQKHTIDILFVEVLQILFWFNPLLIWLKRSIKQNHEYLADYEVLTKGISPSIYQEILLEFSSSEQNMALTNAINYASLKKRFTIMKTQTSRQKMWLRSVLVLPLLAILIYGFSAKEEVYETTNLINGDNPIQLHIDKNGTLFYGTKTIKIEDLAILVELKDNIDFSIEADKNAPPEKVLLTNKKLSKYLTKEGLKRFTICSSQKDFDMPNPQSKGATEAMMKEYKNFIEDFKRTRTIKNDSFDRAVAIYEIMTMAQRESVEKYPEMPFQRHNSLKSALGKSISKPTNQLLEQWKDKSEYAVWIDGKVINNSTLDKHKASDFVHYFQSKVYKNARSEQFPQPFQISIYTKPYYEANFANRDIKEYKRLAKNYTDALTLWLTGDRSDNSELKILKALADKIYNSLSKEKKSKFNLRPTPPLPAESSKTNVQGGATKEEVAEYNKLAKKYYNASKGKIRVYESEVKRMKNIFDRMSKVQRKNAEPYPNLPEPPPPPPAPKKEWKKLKETRSPKQNNSKASKQAPKPVKIKVVEGKAVPIPPPPPPIPADATKEQKRRYKKAIDNYHKKHPKTEIKEIREVLPPPPPPPMNMKKLAEEGATFYYEGKKISSDKAIKLYSNNKDLNVQVIDYGSDKPKVKISKAPIVVERKN